jgi:hypothetical protein
VVNPALKNANQPHLEAKARQEEGVGPPVTRKVALNRMDPGTIMPGYIRP